MDKNDIIANLRALIISSKQGLPISHVQKDYCEAFGVKVPLKDLGCSNLREVFEQNSSDFRLVGDKVEAVVKNNSAHISSLVNRQSGRTKSLKNTKRPIRQGLKKESLYDVSSKRSSHDFREKYMESNKNNASMDGFDNLAKGFASFSLRKPYDIKQLKESLNVNVQPEVRHDLSAKTPLFGQDTAELKSITKTIANDKFPDSPVLSSTLPNEIQQVDDLGPFKDVEDLSISKGAQSRLLRQKSKMLQELKCFDKDQKASGKTNVASEMYFDLDSISSPSDSPSKCLPSSSQLSLSPGQASNHSGNIQPSSVFPQNISTLPILIPRQRAQSRLVSIKSLMQTNIVQSQLDNSEIDRVEVPRARISNDANNNYCDSTMSGQSNDIQLGSESLSKKIGSQETLLTSKIRVKTANQIQKHNLLSYKLPELILPDSKYWEIYITNITSSAEIWCRLIGGIYSDAYDAMMTKLELEPPERKAKDAVVGEIYVMKVSAIWYRVKLMELIDNNQGLIFYIDVGDKDVVELLELYQPDEKLFTVAPQAIKLSLSELESFCDDEDLTAIITGNLLGNTYIAEVLTTLNFNKSFNENPTSICLWDTSTEIDVNVNQLLLNNIIKNIKSPALPNIAQIKEVLVSWVDDKGGIYVQTNKKSVHHLKCIILNKIKSYGTELLNPYANDTIGTEVLYLTKCKKSGFFCRAKVSEILSPSLVHVMYIDYGYADEVSVAELIHLEKSSILQAIPPQAIKVRLSCATNFKVNDILKLSNMILDQYVLMKVITSNHGNVPLVELFKRSTAGSILYSVNMKLSADSETENTDNSGRRKSVVLGLEKVLPKTLPAPVLPSIGEHFEVFIPMASSPDLFIVQPLVSRVQLMHMMTELQTLCELPNNLGVSPEEFQIGELYAVKHPDGHWYRGCAQAAVGSYSYSVYLCDFGDCIMVTQDKLMILPNKFKHFPYQAVRASLFGIPPELKDWTPIDCVEFYKLVVEKNFVSTVMEINRDEKNPNYVNLSLVLTDTSGDRDIYIHKLLMENKNEHSRSLKV